MMFNGIDFFWPEHSLQAGGRWFETSTARQPSGNLSDLSEPGRRLRYRV